MTEKGNVSPGFGVCCKCGGQFKRYSTKSTHNTCQQCMKPRLTTQRRSRSEILNEKERNRRWNKRSGKTQRKIKLNAKKRREYLKLSKLDKWILKQRKKNIEIHNPFVDNKT